MITDLLFQNGDFVLDGAGNLVLVTGSGVIAQDLTARLQCPPGGHFAFPEAGVDLRDYLFAALDELTLLEMRQEVEIECMKDERIYDVTATVTQETLKSCQVDISAQLTDEALTDLGFGFLLEEP